MQATIDNELRVTVPMDVSNLSDLRWSTWAYLAAAGVATGMVEDILIALHEAVANALRHSGASDDIEIRVKAASESVRVEVADWGRGIDPGVAIPPKPPGLAAESGRGLFIIWSLMSSVRLERGSGTHLVMVKDLYPRGI